MQDPDKKPDEKLEGAYRTLMHRVREAFDNASEHISLQQALTRARDTATRLDGMTREEAHKVGEWVRRDLHDAGEYLSSTGHELRDWLYMDKELIEYSLLELFGKAADQTRLALLRFQEQAEHADELATGEITGPGTLECTQCGELLQFKVQGHIPPCPSCHGTRFRRRRSEARTESGNP